MRGATICAVVAALLVGAGWVCWTAGALQARLADASGRMMLLRYEESRMAYDDIEQSLGLAARLPARVTQTVGDVGSRRASALYWEKQYGSLSLERDAAGQLVETDPDILFIAANAVYRSGVRADADRVAAIRALDEAIAGYAEVLRRAPGHVDAAYNYEYAVRARVAAARAAEGPRPGSARRTAAEPPGAKAAAAPTHDLPPGPTLHGQPGAPPDAGEGTKFKMLVPMQPDERQGAPDRTGEGARPVRRG
jgi:hypothetical protein